MLGKHAREGEEHMSLACKWCWMVMGIGGMTRWTASALACVAVYYSNEYAGLRGRGKGLSAYDNQLIAQACSKPFQDMVRQSRSPPTVLQPFDRSHDLANTAAFAIIRKHRTRTTSALL